MTHRICITGPEATGKSTLAQALAKEFGCPWVPEFARDYLKSLGKPYTEHDLEQILRGQIRLEERRATDPGAYLICDTGPEVIWVWGHFKYGRVSPFIDREAKSRHYDHTLLLETDLPWIDDPLRENPSLADRRKLFQLYKDLLTESQRSFTIISGQGHARIESALNALASFVPQER